jgi:hypothetical protein
VSRDGRAREKSKYTWILEKKWGQVLIPWGGGFNYTNTNTARSKKLRQEVDDEK